MTYLHDFQDRGEAARRAAGIDGTAGDAQDIRHRFVRDEPTGACLLCGLAETHGKHIDRLLACGHCYEENGEEVHPHPECTYDRESVAEELPDPAPSAPRCVLCSHPKGDHSGRGDHKPSAIVPRRPWCHACDSICDYAAEHREGPE